jgi:hypothetical protein
MAGMAHTHTYSGSSANPMTSAVAGTVSVSTCITTAIAIPPAITIATAVASFCRMGRSHDGVWQQHGCGTSQKGDERTACDEPIGVFHWDSSLVAGPAEWSKSANSLAIKGH